MAKRAEKLVNLQELAKMAGVSKPAVSLWIRERKTEGIDLVHPGPGREKLVDLHHPLVKRYVQGIDGKRKHAPNSEPLPGEINQQKRKMLASIERLTLKNKMLMGKCVDVNLCIEALNKQHSLFEAAFKKYPGEVLEKIEKELKLTVTKKQREAAAGTLRKQLKDALYAMRRELDGLKN